MPQHGMALEYKDTSSDKEAESKREYSLANCYKHTQALKKYCWKTCKRDCPSSKADKDTQAELRDQSAARAAVQPHARRTNNASDAKTDTTVQCSAAAT